MSNIPFSSQEGDGRGWRQAIRGGIAGNVIPYPHFVISFCVDYIDENREDKRQRKGLAIPLKLTTVALRWRGTVFIT
jgi:hypothetical protein